MWWQGMTGWGWGRAPHPASWATTNAVTLLATTTETKNTVVGISTEYNTIKLIHRFRKACDVTVYMNYIAMPTVWLAKEWRKYRGNGFTPSTLTISVIAVRHSSTLKGSIRQYHNFRGECMARARWELHALTPAPCILFPFDIRFIANQTINSSGRVYLI